MGGTQLNMHSTVHRFPLFQHAMLFFFHHYEIPLILHQEQLLRIVGVAQQEVGKAGCV